MKQIWKSDKGFTLVELLVTLALIVPILSIVFSLFIYSYTSFSKEEMNYDVQNDVRIATDYLVRNVRNATSMELITVNASKAEISSSEPYNYIYIDDDGSIHGYLTDGEGGFYHTTLGQNVSNSSSFFSKYDNSTLRVYIVCVKDTQQYHSDVTVNLLNFALFDPVPEITVSETDYKALKFRLP